MTPEPEEGVACKGTAVPGVQTVVLFVIIRSNAGATVIATSSVKEQPVLFWTVTAYVVLLMGLAKGAALDGLFTELPGVHPKVKPVLSYLVMRTLSNAQLSVPAPELLTCVQRKRVLAVNAPAGNCASTIVQFG